MGKILAKQVQDVMDQQSDQKIKGVKIFIDKTVFDSGEEKHSVVNEHGFIYWAMNIDKLEQEGNFRMGVVKGKLVQQRFFKEDWETI